MLYAPISDLHPYKVLLILKYFITFFFVDHKIKVVRSDRGREYYGRHTDIGQAPGPFYNFARNMA